MQIFTIVLLILVFILLILDVVFLYRIQKSPITRNRNTFDKRFFELKFEIRLIEVVATILLFVGTFLGASSLNEIKTEYKSDLEVEIKALRDETYDFETKLLKYTKTLDSLKSEEGKSIENLSDIKREFGVIDKKLSNNNQAFKNLIKVYAVKEVEFSPNIVDNVNKKSPQKKIEYQDIYFNTLKTMYGERLPEFQDIPLVVIQSKIIEIELISVTNDFFRITRKQGGYEDVFEGGKKLDKSFNLIIASRD